MVLPIFKETTYASGICSSINFCNPPNDKGLQHTSPIKLKEKQIESQDKFITWEKF